MEDAILHFISSQASSAPWMIFILLMLAGLNIPFSEDLLLITGGMISAAYFQNPFYFLVWIYIGCILSAWEAYWIGRTLGPKLYANKWFGRVITHGRMAKLNHYYEKYGIFTFIVGRFCPGGVRNALFMTAGLGKMPFSTFVMRDSFACLISTPVLFSIGYFFAKNYDLLYHYFKMYSLCFLSLLIAIAVVVTVIVWIKKKTAKKTPFDHQSATSRS